MMVMASDPANSSAVAQRRASEPPAPTRADYEAAARVMPQRLNAAIRNAAPALRWIGTGAWAWYKCQTAAGDDYVLIDAASGEKQPVFDQAALAIALDGLVSPVDARNLPIIDLVFSDDLATVTIVTPTATLAWNRLENRSIGAEPSATPAIAQDESRSPDGRWAVLRRGDNLWVRDAAVGAERALTHDGTADRSYGKLPDDSLIAVKAQRTGMVMPPVGLVWSPDSSRLIVPRVDESAIAPYVFLQNVSPEGGAPVPYPIRRPVRYEDDRATIDYVVIDLATGAQRRIVLPDAVRLDLRGDPEWWSVEGSTLHALLTSTDSKQMALIAIDLTTGETRTIVDEVAAKTDVHANVALYSGPNVRILGRGWEALWFSERDGHGHLYLYDIATSSLKRQLTTGPTTVFDIIATDERNRELYYTASPRAGQGDPYHRQLYRVSLDGGEPVRLTDPGQNHLIQAGANAAFALYFGAKTATSAISPDFTCFVDVASTVTQPPVTSLRSTRDGHEIAVIESADISGLQALGYRPPEPFVVTVADGVTDLHGVLYWPPAESRCGPRSLPIIDAIYNGPQIASVPHSYTAGFNNSAWSPTALARLGFVVMVLDARGTAMRDKAFHDASYGVFEDAGMDDHIAAIRELARRYPEIDPNRVGAYGGSYGGYYAANAVLRHGDVYKAAVAAAGGYDRKDFYSLAPNLSGKLMLVAADMDENVPPTSTYQLADALQHANKDFDLVILANRVHSQVWDPYVVRRMWDFFVRHLLGVEPPRDFSLQDVYAKP